MAFASFESDSGVRVFLLVELAHRGGGARMFLSVELDFRTLLGIVCAGDSVASLSRGYCLRRALDGTRQKLENAPIKIHL